ncbi:MAG TPA: hypothetical protein VK912_06530 [Longimicrobiales bacterium]|nr:hypothetical protein [Longimicrobiales bacterium]
MIPERVSCAECEIVIEDVAVIGDTTDDRSLAGRPFAVWQDETGRYFINVLDAFPMVYHPDTGVLDDFGRQGGGPGEFRHPTIRALLPGDSLLVTDGVTYHVVAPDLTVARSVTVGADLPSIAVVDWPGRVTATGHSFDRASGMIQWFAAEYDMSGEAVQVRDTLLMSEMISGGDASWISAIRMLGEVADDGGVWISDYNTYRLVQYRDGEPVDSIMRRPDWFPGGEPARLGSPTEPTTPHMLGSWMDEGGLLWVLASQPRLDTRDVWKDMPSFEGAREVRVASLPADYKLNRTVVEVIDLTERRVLTRHTFDGYIIDILPDQRLASFVETEDGVPVLRIHEVSLRREGN